MNKSSSIHPLHFEDSVPIQVHVQNNEKEESTLDVNNIIESKNHL
jgi:hypothetical protein